MSSVKIKHIEINNFKCHKNFCSDLLSLNVLAGSNAAGKSSFIQAILLAYKAWKECDRGQINTNDIFGLNLGLPATIISEEAEEKGVTIKIACETVEDVVLLELSDDDNELYFNILNTEEIVDQKAKAESLCLLNFFFLNAERVGPRITQTINSIQSYSVGNVGENTAYVINEIDKQQKLKGLKLPEKLKISELDRFSANCEEWLKIIIPETELRTFVDVEMNIASIKFKNDGEYYLPTATGFGITYVLPIIVQALLAAMIENSVLFIENPEAHLHPYSQSQLGKFFVYVALSGVQVIVETHSEHIVDGCRIQAAKEYISDEMQVLFFSKDNGKCSCKSISVSDDGELLEWPAGFFDQKRQDLKELLEMRRCKK